MKKLLTLIFLFITFVSHAQIKALTETGREVFYMMTGPGNIKTTQQINP